MAERRVLFITPQPFFSERGSPYRVRAEVQAIVAGGCEVDLLSYPIGRDIELMGVRQYRAPNLIACSDVPIGWSWTKLCLDVLLFWKATVLVVSAALRGKHYAMIHGVEEAGVMAALLAVVFRIPYVFDMHSHMSEQLSQCVIRPGGMLFGMLTSIERWSMRRAAGIVTVSDVITARVRECSPTVPALTLEDLALDAGVADPAQIKKLREELSVGDRTVLVYTGNFEPYQGIDLLLDGYAAFARQSETASRSVLILVGGGREDDPRFIRHRQFVQQNGLTQSVLFAGQRGEAEMGAFMAMADFLLSPRIAGAHTPLKIYSYMAAKKSIIATRITAHTNVLSDDNAFLADPTPTQLGVVLHEAITLAQSAPDLVAQRVQQAADLLESRFSRKEFFRRMSVLYRAALGEQQSAELMMSPENLRTRAGQRT